jgi:mono/diheme cytochrome c family protein
MNQSLAMAALALMLTLPATAAAEQESAPAVSAQELAVGARVYAENCASCHGANLEGQPNWRRLNES